MNWNPAKQSFVEVSRDVLYPTQVCTGNPVSADAGIDEVIDFFTSGGGAEMSRGKDAGEDVAAWFY
ncbi:MAG: hypothetical protein KGZ83_12355 [Sulfuricella sp.]|nr:hypothetical protein [Sulfuricella sp.]